MNKYSTMNEIQQIYRNDFGIAFYWKKHNEILFDKIQIVFRETGLHLTLTELQEFGNLIEDSRQKNGCCSGCEFQNQCHTFLLKTPCAQIDLAVSMPELNLIKDLVEGCLFKINLDDYIYGSGLN